MHCWWLMHCFKEDHLNNEYELIFENLRKAVVNNFSTIKLRKYKKLNLGIIGAEEQKSLITNYHEGKTYHRGINESYLQVRRKYYWPSMLRDITSNINECATYLITKYDRRPIQIQYQIAPSPDKPF